MLRFLALIPFVVSLGGCYYVQAAAGQWEVLRKREDIVKVIADDETPPELARRLQLVVEARRFAVTDLGLPDNDSYRTYSDIAREFVVWNVFAAPEFSMQAKEWCFPVAGCVSYRGYFDRDAALREASKLRGRGYDVAVGGVAAYSTLGRFDDPVLSSMMRWDDTQLVGVLFHELAHQVLYVKGDSGFNESFATAVEEFGVTRWLAKHGGPGDPADYERERQVRQDLMQLVAIAREDLQALYDEEIDEAGKRRGKSARLAQLARDAATLLEQSGRDPSGWLDGELNNARLVSLTLYEGRLPAMRALLARCGEDLGCFYREATRLSELDSAERDAKLDALAGGELLGP